MRAQYADALISCNKYRQINYQLPNEVISRSMTLPRALALCAVSPKTKLDGREIDRSKPLLASSHAMIWSSRLPKPPGGTAILTLTGPTNGLGVRSGGEGGTRLRWLPRGSRRRAC